MRFAILYLLLMGGMIKTVGQQFIGEALLPKVQSDSFYRIHISSDLGVYLNENYSNIRLFDDENIEVPYLWEEESAAYTTQQFIEYSILENTAQKGCCSTLLLHNPDRQAITNITLLIKNADVSKEATLLGSDDQKQWYALKQRFVLSNINDRNQTAELRIVDFPLSNYSYFLIKVNDSTTAPLNILNAGYYKPFHQNGMYETVPVAELIKSDSAEEKKSYVKISFDTLRFVDKVEMNVSGVPYYLRQAMIYEKKDRITKKGNKESYYSLLHSFEISSKTSTVIELPESKVKELLIVIDNKDNPPLNVSSVKAFQLNRYLVAHLKANSQYVIKFGKQDLRGPVYDIAFFKNSIPAITSILDGGRINLYEKNVQAEIAPQFFTGRLLIWVAIVAIIIVLGYMSVRLMRDANTIDKKSD